MKRIKIDFIEFPICLLHYPLVGKFNERIEHIISYVIVEQALKARNEDIDMDEMDDRLNCKYPGDYDQSNDIHFKIMFISSLFKYKINSVMDLMAMHRDSQKHLYNYELKYGNDAPTRVLAFSLFRQ